MEQSIALTDRREHRQLFSLNLIRAFAIILVILDHSMRSDLSESASDLINLIINPDAAMFFMVSGALLFPVTRSWGEFLRRRFVRVFVPFVVWVIIYALVYHHYGIINTDSLASQIRWGWMWYNFQAGWFVPFIMMVYLVMPLLSPWIARASRRQFNYVLVLWLISGLMPWFQAIAGVQPRATMFAMMYNGVPFAIMGYYFLKCRRDASFPVSCRYAQADGSEQAAARHSRWKRWAVYAGLLLFGLVLPFIFRNAARAFDLLKVSISPWGIQMILMAIFYFNVLLRVRTLGRTLDKIVNVIARYSFGIYLCQELFQNTLLPRYLPQFSDSTPMSFLLIFSCSFLLTAILRRIPFLGRYII